MMRRRMLQKTARMRKREHQRKDQMKRAKMRLVTESDAGGQEDQEKKQDEAESENVKEVETGGDSESEDSESTAEGTESSDESDGSSESGSEDSESQGGDEEDDKNKDDGSKDGEKTGKETGKENGKETSGEKILQKAEKKALPNSVTHRAEWMRLHRWKKSKKFPPKLAAQMQTEQGRMEVFQDYLKCGCHRSQTLLKVERRLEESQKTTLKYGFRNETWLIKHHGEAKARKIMARKRSLGL